MRKLSWKYLKTFSEFQKDELANFVLENMFYRKFQYFYDILPPSLLSQKIKIKIIYLDILITQLLYKCFLYKCFLYPKKNPINKKELIYLKSSKFSSTDAECGRNHIYYSILSTHLGCGNMGRKKKRSRKWFRRGGNVGRQKHRVVCWNIHHDW